METEDYSSICYGRTFLSQVIIRLDFLDFIPSNSLFYDDKIKCIREIFPKVSMSQIMRFNDVQVNLSTLEPETACKTIEGLSQTFSDQSDNKLVISNKFFVLEINQYKRFEDALKMLDMVPKLFGTSNLNVTRTGIRYINIFEDSQLKLSKKYFTSSVNSLVNTNLSRTTNKYVCIRSMCMNEYQVEDMRLNFRFGMFNPQYPNAMRSASFALDYDCYCDNLINGYDEITSHIMTGHDAIQQLFEDSISDSLRKIMKNG